MYIVISLCQANDEKNLLTVFSHLKQNLKIK